MKIELPVLIEQLNNADGAKCHRVRAVFLAQPEAANRGVDAAMHELSNLLHERINVLIKEKNIAEIVRWSYTPEMRLQQIEIVLDLPRRFARIWVHCVTFEACGRIMAVCPYIPSLPWFELEKPSQLESRLAEVLRKYYRDVRKNFGSDALERELTPFEKRRTIRLSHLALYLDQLRQKRKNPKSKITTRKQELIDEGKEQIKQVGTCLDRLHPNGLHQTVCRDAMVERIYRLLTEPERKAVLLVGPPKVGKTALIHSTVAKMVETIKRPEHDPQRQTVWHLTPGRLISGMSMSGEWEGRINAIFAYAEAKDLTLNFSQLIGLLNTGKTSHGNLSMADLLLQAIRRRQFRAIAELTEEQFRILRERNRALADQFEIVHVAEPPPEDNVRMLLHIVRELESKWRCMFAADLLPLVIDLTQHYEDAAAMPGKAVEWLSALAMRHQENAVTREHFLAAFREKTALKLAYFNNDNRTKQTSLEIDTWFHSRIVGQQTAVEALRDVVMVADSMLADPNRPIASLFFLGPTGVGKTECAKQLAAYLFGNNERLIRFDANELCTSQAVARLVGSYQNGEGLLTGAIRRQPFSVVLFDEIEKAHPNLFDLLLQVIGEARLTDTMGRVASFSQAIVIFTSNLGTRRTLDGFSNSEKKHAKDSHFMKAVNDFFRPEFVNRVDRVVPFSFLSYDEREIIADRMLDEIAAREGLKRRKCKLLMTLQARDWIVKQESDPLYGARSIRRLLERELVAPVSRFLASANAENPVVIEVSLNQSQTSPLHVEGFELKQADPLTQPDWHNAEYFVSLGRDKQERILHAAKQSLRNMQNEFASLRPQSIGDVSRLLPTDRLYFRLNEEVTSLREEADELLEMLETNLLEHVDLPPATPKRCDFDTRHRGTFRSFWKHFMNSVTTTAAIDELFTSLKQQNRLQLFFERLAKLRASIEWTLKPSEQAIVLSMTTDHKHPVEPTVPNTLLAEAWELEMETVDFGFGLQKVGKYLGPAVREYWKSQEGSTLEFHGETMHVRSVVVLDDLNERFNKWPPIVKIIRGVKEIDLRGEMLALPEGMEFS